MQLKLFIFKYFLFVTFSLKKFIKLCCFRVLLRILFSRGKNFPFFCRKTFDRSRQFRFFSLSPKMLLYFHFSLFFVYCKASKLFHFFNKNLSLFLSGLKKHFLLQFTLEKQFSTLFFTSWTNYSLRTERID